MKLTAKHQAFISHYLTCWIGAEAARRTDPAYKRPDQVAYEYLRIPEIQEEIQRRLAELKMGSDETLTRLSDHARGSIADFIDVSEPDAKVETAETMDEAHAAHVGWRLNLAKAKRDGKLHLIKKLKSGQWGPEIELHDPQSALTLLGKHHKLFGDAGGVLKSLDLSKLSKEQVQRIADGEDPLAVLLNTTSDTSESRD